MITVSCIINGKGTSFDVADRTLLVSVLRDHLRMTGTNVGCDTSQCGACTVHLNGRAVKSCTVLAGDVEQSSIVTIEGIADGNQPHPMQIAFSENSALQCGYCTSGMIMQALDILRRHGPSVGAAEIREELEGNICRCTGYENIVKAIQAAAFVMHDQEKLVLGVDRGQADV